jgi:hypothetical protein
MQGLIPPARARELDREHHVYPEWKQHRAREDGRQCRIPIDWVLGHETRGGNQVVKAVQQKVSTASEVATLSV